MNDLSDVVGCKCNTKGRQKGRPKVPKEKERNRNAVSMRFFVRKLEGQSTVFMTLPGIQQWGYGPSNHDRDHGYGVHRQLLTFCVSRGCLKVSAQYTYHQIGIKCAISDRT